MPHHFIIDAFRSRKKEPRWLKYIRIAGTLGALGYMAFILTEWIEDISSKEVDVGESNSYLLLPDQNKNIQPIWPNARICLIGDVKTLMNSSTVFIPYCTMVDSNNNAQGTCPGVFKPLAGFNNIIGDVSFPWPNTKGRVYKPYWKDGYCFHYSSIGLQDRPVTNPIRFDLQTIPALQKQNFPNDDAYFDILFLDPRNDPMVLLYNLTEETRTNRGIQYYNTYIEEFVDNDEFQQPNEYFLTIDQSQKTKFVPVYSERVRDDGWNYIGIFPVRNQYWELQTNQLPDEVLTPGYQATIELLSTVPEDANPIIKIETRKYSISSMLQTLYLLYIAIGSTYINFFGVQGTSNPFGYFRTFIEIKKVKDYGKGDTLPFSNLSKPTSPHDVEAVYNRLINLEKVLAEYYIDVNKFKNRDVGPPKSMKQKLYTFGKEIYKNEIKEKGDDEDEEEGMGEDIDLGEISVK